MCTTSLLETMQYYNNNKSSVYVLYLNASKVFDRLNMHAKLSKIMLHRNVRPVIVRLLFNIYEQSTMRVNWSHMSNRTSFKCPRE